MFVEKIERERGVNGFIAKGVRTFIFLNVVKMKTTSYLRQYDEWTRSFPARWPPFRLSQHMADLTCMGMGDNVLFVLYARA